MFMTPEKIELVLIFSATIIGVVSAAYFYSSTDMFVRIIRRPFKFIASGVLLIMIGVLVAAFISYASRLGISIIFFGLPLQVFFYILYIIGSLLIARGAQTFSRNVAH
jgi:hypothetical protein